LDLAQTPFEPDIEGRLAAKEINMGTAERGDKHVVKGVVNRVKGKINEVAGAAKGDLSQELKGKAQKTAGKIQQKVGNLEQDLGRAHDESTDPLAPALPRSRR
jgi:uncharacterized protein YjbJ (UPF0337 family)